MPRLLNRLVYLWNRHVLMPYWWRADLRCVRRYERAFLRASHAERALWAEVKGRTEGREN